MPDFQDHDTEEHLVCHMDVRCIRETPKAILCVVEGKQVWIPRSQVDDLSEVYTTGTEGNLVITRWFAEKEGWV